LTRGDPWLDDLLRLRGIEAVRDYLLAECQAVYRDNGVAIDDRHFEVILARVLARWRVEDGGDTYLLPGAVISWQELMEANRRVAGRVRITEAGSSAHARGTLLDEHEFRLLLRRPAGQGGSVPRAVSATPATAAPLGLTRAAAESESFLSAASFQHTRKVLLEAALAGKLDPLEGLKENVLLGRLIPAGSGFEPSRNERGSATPDVTRRGSADDELRGHDG
jgi:DNA-directed RNA polymerase subunit beta'